MIIKSLELENYRNYKNLCIEFDEGTNILTGENAQGKTNILEAIYLCSTTKSHKGSKDGEIINFGNDEGHVRTKINKKEEENNSTNTNNSNQNTGNNNNQNNNR